MSEPKRRPYGAGRVQKYATKSGNRYALAYWATTATGQRRQVRRGGFRTKREAERALREALVERDHGQAVDPKPDHSGAVHPAGLPAPRWQAGPTEHARQVEKMLRRHVLPHFGSVKMQALTPAHVNAWLDAPAAAPSTIRYAFTLFGAALSLAVAEELIPRNPMQHPSVVPPRVPRRAMQVWSPKQVQRFLTATSEEPLWMVWVLLARTGMRRGEVLGLRWADIDLGRGRLVISRSLGWLDGKPLWSDGKTASSRRVVPLDPGTVDLLRKYRASQMEQALAMAEAWISSRLLFQDVYGQAPVSEFRVGEVPPRDQEARASGDPVARPEARVRDFGVEGRVPLKIVSMQLGHSSVSQTADTYTHVSDESAARWNEVVNRYMSGEDREVR